MDFFAKTKQETCGMQKNNDLFWNIWNKKIGNQKIKSNIIKGSCNEIEAANSFANIFSNTQLSNNDKQRLQVKLSLMKNYIIIQVIILIYLLRLKQWTIL